MRFLIIKKDIFAVYSYAHTNNDMRWTSPSPKKYYIHWTLNVVKVLLVSSAQTQPTNAFFLSFSVLSLSRHPMLIYIVLTNDTTKWTRTLLLVIFLLHSLILWLGCALFKHWPANEMWDRKATRNWQHVFADGAISLCDFSHNVTKLTLTHIDNFKWMLIGKVVETFYLRLFTDFTLVLAGKLSSKSGFCQ